MLEFFLQLASRNAEGDLTCHQVRDFPVASWLACRALIDEVDLIAGAGVGSRGMVAAKLTQLSCTFALSFSVLWFPYFPDYALPMLSCWTPETIRACRPQRKRPAWWSMSSMVRAVRTPNSGLNQMYLLQPHTFCLSSCSVLHRRKPRSDAKEQGDPDQWQHAKQSIGPPSGHGGQFRCAMAYWWPTHREQQLPWFLLEFIHSAYQLLQPACENHQPLEGASMFGSWIDGRIMIIKWWPLGNTIIKKKNILYIKNWIHS